MPAPNINKLIADMKKVLFEFETEELDNIKCYMLSFGNLINYKDKLNSGDSDDKDLILYLISIICVKDENIRLTDEDLKKITDIDLQNFCTKFIDKYNWSKAKVEDYNNDDKLTLLTSLLEEETKELFNLKQYHQDSIIAMTGFFKKLAEPLRKQQAELDKFKFSIATQELLKQQISLSADFNKQISKMSVSSEARDSVDKIKASIIHQKNDVDSSEFIKISNENNRLKAQREQENANNIEDIREATTKASELINNMADTAISIQKDLATAVNKAQKTSKWMILVSTASLVITATISLYQWLNNKEEMLISALNEQNALLKEYQTEQGNIFTKLSDVIENNNLLINQIGSVEKGNIESINNKLKSNNNILNQILKHHSQSPTP